MVKNHTTSNRISVQMRRDGISENLRKTAAWAQWTPVVSIEGYTADAFAKMLAAGTFGVHRREIRLDAIARIEQALSIRVVAFESRTRGTGESRCWYRLPQTYEYCVVSVEETEIAA